MKKNRDSEFLELDETCNTNLDWQALRNKVKLGMRNSNVMAIAPTATISNICSVNQSVEPIYQNLYVKTNMSGDFTVINQYLILELEKLNLWNDKMLQKIKYHEGSIQKIDNIPQHLKKIYLTAFEIDIEFLIRAAARRQKWIDQSQSLNIYIAKPSGKKIHDVYMKAWKLGLKTTYYLRSLGATNAEKSTVEKNSLNAVKIQTNYCNIDDENCEVCL